MFFVCVFFKFVCACFKCVFFRVCFFSSVCVSFKYEDLVVLVRLSLFISFFLCFFQRPREKTKTSMDLAGSVTLKYEELRLNNCLNLSVLSSFKELEA